MDFFDDYYLVSCPDVCMLMLFGDTLLAIGPKKVTPVRISKNKKYLKIKNLSDLEYPTLLAKGERELTEEEAKILRKLIETARSFQPVKRPLRFFLEKNEYAKLLKKLGL